MVRTPAFKPTVIPAGLLILFFLLSLGAVRHKSPTFDETLHLFAGYSNLRWGDFGINPEHPPLAKIVAALPLLTLHLNEQGLEKNERDRSLMERGHAWELANRLLFLNNDAETIFLHAKVVMILLATGLGVAVFVWARELYGLGAATLALFFYCCDPNILGHSAIVHTDVPFALVFFVATYFYWHSLNEFSWAHLFLTALFFALAAITKFTFVVVLPIWLVLGVVRVFARNPQRSKITEPEWVNTRRGKVTLLIIILATVVLAGYLTIWLTYGLRFDAAPYPRGQLPSLSAAAHNPWLESVVRFASEYLFLPNSWIFGITDAFRSLDRPAYLMGEIAKQGFWLYFPIAFLVKTPLPTLILVLTGIVYMPFSKDRKNASIFLIVPIGVYFFTAMWSHINIGIRHLLPIYPFLFVWLSGYAASLWQSGNRSVKLGMVGLVIWLFASTVRSYPDYLAFFNEMVGGAKNGHKFLVDSNLDWGQDLKGLKVWMEQNKVDKIQLAYFGTANPSYYAIDADYLPGTLFSQVAAKSNTHRKASHIAISATYLMGYNLLDPNTYKVFRQRTPVAIIGHSIWVYKL